MGQGTSNPRVVSRFIESNAPPDNTPLPDDYLRAPTTSIDEALKPVSSRLNNLETYVSTAKYKFNNKNVSNLTQDEAAAIYLYTIQWPVGQQSLYVIFNQDLRTKNRSTIEKWQLYLKLLMSALNKLPSQRLTVYRGVNKDISKDFTEGTQFVWSSATSCTRDASVAPYFANNSNDIGTLFQIEVSSGRDISSFSEFPKEEEVLIRPGTKFLVTKGPMLHTLHGKNLYVIHLKEV